MFALIITLASIALAVALVVATIYYGGSSSRSASLKTVAASLINQGTQINAAGSIAVSQGVGWPADSPQFTEPFLSSMPVPPKAAYVEGLSGPAAADWEYYVADKSTHHFVLRDKIGKGVCEEVNKSQGLVGIPATWDGTTMIQCFGPGTIPAGASAPAYSFFYDPVGSTPPEDAKALTQSLAEAVSPTVPSPTPGYPRLCPDDTTINTGVCPTDDSAPKPSLGIPGFYIITGTAGAYSASLVSNGWFELCPVGAVNVAGPGVTPVVSNGAEKLNVDGAMQYSWMLPPDYDGPAQPITRVWCFPASSTEPLGTGVLAQDVSVADMDISYAPAIPGIEKAYRSAVTAQHTFTVGGVQWTALATSFEFDVVIDGDDNQPWLIGDKLAVGRTGEVSETYFGGVPSLSYGGNLFANGSGKLVLTPGALMPSTVCSGSWQWNFVYGTCTITNTTSSVARAQTVGTYFEGISSEIYEGGPSNCDNKALYPGDTCTFAYKGSSFEDTPTSTVVTFRIVFNVDGTEYQYVSAPLPYADVPHITVDGISTWTFLSDQNGDNKFSFYGSNFRPSSQDLTVSLCDEYWGSCQEVAISQAESTSTELVVPGFGKNLTPGNYHLGLVDSYYSGMYYDIVVVDPSAGGEI